MVIDHINDIATMGSWWVLEMCWVPTSQECERSWPCSEVRFFTRSRNICSRCCRTVLPVCDRHFCLEFRQFSLKDVIGSLAQCCRVISTYDAIGYYALREHLNGQTTASDTTSLLYQYIGKKKKMKVMMIIRNEWMNIHYTGCFETNSNVNRRFLALLYVPPY